MGDHYGEFRTERAAKYYYGDFMLQVNDGNSKLNQQRAFSGTWKAMIWS